MNTKPIIFKDLPVIDIYHHNYEFININKTCPIKQFDNKKNIVETKILFSFEFEKHKKYNWNNVNMIIFAKEIPLQKFKNNLKDIFNKYKSKKPYATYKDFFDSHYLEPLLNYIYKIVEKDFNFLDMPMIWYNENFDLYYTGYYKNKIYFAIPDNKDFDYFKHYYSRVLEIIKTFDLQKEQQDNNNAPLNETPKQTEIQNPYPHIFKDKAYLIFKDFKDTIEKNEIANYSFIYRKMIYDNFIFDNFNPSMYRNWLNIEFDVNIGQLKTYDNCRTSDKERLYSMIKDRNK